MDDMDLENEEVGLKTQFFIDDYTKYSWRKLIDNRLSGQEKLDLYVEAVANIPKNPNIPQLFRDIFKGAFLPFRDPRTLSLFLKEINEFSYQNSENLGDAFEYLLSILGSQGDAGQFRTPRHIIDFIIEAISPKKNETILDPACGTAGFLISAYKHILKNNSSNFKPEEEKSEDKIVQGETATETLIQEKKNYNGDLLTPNDKTKLTENISGYDISPDMVKLSLVNLYLHGFSNPKIYEYDTLSSDKRWDENFDVIFANPPFMTPKGGISPHKKFSVQANRAEVLFVDYIAEHLSIKGRAGIIVPEGIIFQSSNAYKSLRKNLIENWGLYAVVSLPSGVFNPYAGVKTSILLIDREFSKKSKEILFLKVENDSFDLGAQRRKIEKNDLPDCLQVLESWKKDQTVDENLKFAFAVKKSTIAENGDYNLTGDRYCAVTDYSKAKWPMVELGELIEFEQKSKRKSGDGKEKGLYKFFVSSQNQNKFIDEADYLNENLILGTGGTASVHIASNFSTSADTFIFHSKDAQVNNIYLYNVLLNNKEVLENGFRGQGIKHLSKEYLLKIQIPLPPLEIQEQIVAEIEQYQKVIDGAKQVVENWKPSFRIDPSWEMVELGEVCEISSGNTAPQEKKLFVNGKYPFYRTSDVGSVHLSDNLVDVRDWLNDEGIKGLKLFKKGAILFPKSGASTFLNHRVIMGQDGYVASHLATITVDKTKANKKYIYFLLTKIDAKDITPNQAYPSLKTSEIKQIQIPLPPLEVQEQIVAEIEAEHKIVNANKELMEKMEKKVEAKIGEVWGDEI